MTRLFIFSGLPGTGKTTLSKAIAYQCKATYLRIDTIEQQLRESGSQGMGALGYEIAYRIAHDNLALGVDVVADSVNPVRLSRMAWENIALQNHANFINIEVICSDTTEHQQRIQSRNTDIPGLKLPTWQDVQQREYEHWSKNEHHILIDTSGRSPTDAQAELFRLLSRFMGI